jgi:5-methylcytosine-specific restriction endonuclease McrA
MPVLFLEKLLQLLIQGGFTSTYKYAVLLALLDLSMEQGSPPTSLTTTQLAQRIIELYWPQVRPYQKRVLQQNAGRQASIASLIENFHRAHPELTSVSKRNIHPEYKKLLRDVEWVLVEYPLPRLQRVGGAEERFLYEINWDDSIKRSAFNSPQFDNRILFKPGAAESLLSLAPVLRPLLQQHWMAKIRQLNRLPESELESFLFGAERARLLPLQKPLKELQGGACFYCQEELDAKSQVDHFLPWSRYPDDGLDNLVLAHGSCNSSKSNLLAAPAFAERWEKRSRDDSALLDQIAGQKNWIRDRTRTFGIVAGVYQNLPEGIWLWSGRDKLLRAEKQNLERLHQFGSGLLSCA